MKAFACDEKGALRTLGGEFIGKLNTLSWGKATRCPRIKNACLMANLGSTKVSDGICKLLLPAHLNMLLAKENRELVMKAELLMENARALCDAMIDDSGIRVHALGLLDTRCILFICKKGKEGEGRVFDSLDEIGDAFVAQLADFTKSHIANPWRKAVEEEGAAASSASAPTVASPETVQDLKSQKVLAKKAGFAMHVHVVYKKDPKDIYTITSMNDGHASMILRETDITLETPYEDLLNDWKVYSGKVALVLAECVSETCSPLLSAEWKTMAARGAVAIAMQKYVGEQEKEAYDKLEVYQSKGVVVRAKAPIPKGTLTLAIASQRLDQKKANGSFRVCTF